ncbi:DUF4297 family anti-phage-associated protein [Vagococcus fessus]|uniref:CD-NTase associated protein 4-like DNA endonuclease domain-containing protein n=1 Tax=Vagococcus fessus TaxID=120370 RepID=A0A430A7I2_9ENTE|nr:DUF4297 family anti-phage-associated protein [Vagococcus fessus]RSU03070.1 hypothetical protein CBF31_04965 [Vagococcus fessus]
MTNRSAKATIKGYQYQFNLSILEILKLKALTDEVTIEGVEDIDITEESGELEAIQIKYYEGTKYSPSIIAKPIRWMLKDFSENFNKDRRYKIYGYYSNSDKIFNQESEKIYVDLEDFKNKFLIYTKDSKIPEDEKVPDDVKIPGKPGYYKRSIKYHEESDINLSDQYLEKFISRLEINVKAKEFKELENDIIKEFIEMFSCDKHEAKIYFEKAKAIISELAIGGDGNNKISKEVFLESLKNNKRKLYNIWMIDELNIRQYEKKVKHNLNLTQMNLSPNERFFIIEIDKLITNVEIKVLLQEISKKLSVIPNGKRKLESFCPYFFLRGISNERLAVIKKLFDQDGENLIDGYKYKDSDFDTEFIKRRPSVEHPIKYKFCNSIMDLDSTINSLEKTREIFEFYYTDSLDKKYNHRHELIRINSTNDIRKLI